ncbi:DNA repair exonuclease [Clostridium sp. CF012]|uniref:metallophosphoesterase family protein n=1 Tax=Clostridium sp. CF012 TaxID=2843319 RepID=UPI001C0DFEC2|nr:DNA repair exonuclease [Clostridium sp. CF012]MBU3146308.1 DNA repair exonuclease [Clostridium sp. CF012]
MSGTLRFIHAADLHIGSFLNINGKPPEEIQALCSEAVYGGYERICNIAILYKVDFILICGDVYDSYLRSVRGNRFFINQCTRLSEINIHVYVIYGNHDAANEKQELFDMPINVHILSSDSAEIYEVCKDDEIIAKIVGKSYKLRSEREKIYENYLMDNDSFNIAMLHTALERDNKNYVPCTLEELKAVPNIDYWALGHIHKTNILSSIKPIIAFPGIPQGRDMGEQGQGGVFYIEVCKKDIIKMEFLPIATIIYKRVEIIIVEESKIENFSDLMGLILDKTKEVTYGLTKIYNEFEQPKEAINDEFKGHILQLVIKGRTELQDKITHMKEEDYKQFVEDINEELSTEKYFMWVDSIIFRTAPLMQDFESLKMQNSIFADLDEVISLYREEGEHRVELVKNWGSIWKKQIYTENMNEDKFDIDEEIIEDIISQARELVIEKLVEALEIM